jgi:hypothetical protein
LDPVLFSTRAIEILSEEPIAQDLVDFGGNGVNLQVLSSGSFSPEYQSFTTLAEAVLAAIETNPEPAANDLTRVENMNPRLVVFALMVLVPVLAGAEGEKDFRAVIDWSTWDAILSSHVVDGRVDYDAIGSDPGFTATVADIASADLEGSSPDSVLVFYINAYNVLAVDGILNGRSPRSSLGKLRFFYRDKYTVAGEALSLHALENQRIRTLGEPRIHFAIICASASCPPLRSEAYVPHALDAQLDDNARRFINDPAKNSFETEHSVANVSKIFKWFSEDFEGAAGNVQRYIADYVEDDQLATSLREGRFRLRYLDYDWSLNGTFSRAKR